MTEQLDRRGRRNLIINIVLMVILVILIAVSVIAKYVLSPMKVSGESMLPTLTDGQIVLMHHTKDLDRGDIVVYHHGDKMVVKRLIAKAGDRVKIDAEGYVYINGDKLNEDYILDGKPIMNARECDIVIEEEQYFFLGDNRNNSNDSEDYGPVDASVVMGKLI